MKNKIIIIGFINLNKYFNKLNKYLLLDLLYC